MKKWLAALAALLLAAPASATTYYVNAATGSDNNAGGSTAPWRSITHANRNALPGDKVLIFPGDYTSGETINPDSAASRANGAYIRFVGATVAGSAYDGLDPTNLVGKSPQVALQADSAATYAIVIKGGALTGNYVTVNGVHYAGTLTISGDRDSIKNCVVGHPGSTDGNLDLYKATGLSGPDYNSISQSVFHGAGLRINHDDDVWANDMPTANGNVIANCDFRGLGRGDFSTYGDNPWKMSACDSVTIKNCRMICRMDQFPQNFGYHYTLTSSTLIHNRWEVDYALGSAWTRCWWSMRDSSQSNTFRADTIYLAGASHLIGEWQASGSRHGNSANTTLDSLRIYAKNCDNVFDFGGGYPVQGLTMTNNVVVADGGIPLKLGVFVGASTISHNTLINRSTYWQPSVLIDHTSTNLAYSDTTSFINNILYCFGDHPSGLRLFVGTLTDPPNLFIARWNLYGVWYCDGACGSLWNFYDEWWDARGGGHAKAGGGKWSFASMLPDTQRVNGDSLSYHGTPLFVDSTGTRTVGGFNAFTVDARLSTAKDRDGNYISAAIGRSKTGGDIGAITAVAHGKALWSPTNLAFTGTYIAGGADTLTVLMQNTGTDTLRVTSVTSSSSLIAATPATAPYVAINPVTGSQVFTIVLTPDGPGQGIGTVTFVTDDPSASHIIIPFSINLVPAPITGNDEPGDGLKIPKH